MRYFGSRRNGNFGMLKILLGSPPKIFKEIPVLAWVTANRR